MCEVLLYTSHNDPQLRGNAAILIGRFVRAVLGEGCGSWDNWMSTLHPSVICGVLTFVTYVQMFKQFQ